MLTQAAIDGDAPLVEALIAAGADVNARDDKGCSALLFAVAKGHSAVVEELIANGADVNVAAGYGMTPLLLAMAMRDERMTKLLKEAGAVTGFEAAPGPPKHPGNLPEDLLRP